jgi:hypothetical protein
MLKMIKHIWTVICQKSFVDRESNNFSLIETLEYIGLDLGGNSEKATINVPFPFDWVTMWRREDINKPSRCYCKDIVLSPSGKVVRQEEHEVDCVKFTSMRMRRRVGNLEVSESGEYRFITQGKSGKKDKWVIYSDIPLIIEIRRKARKSSKPA